MGGVTNKLTELALRNAKPGQTRSDDEEIG